MSLSQHEASGRQVSMDCIYIAVFCSIHHSKHFTQQATFTHSHTHSYTGGRGSIRGVNPLIRRRMHFLFKAYLSSIHAHSYTDATAPSEQQLPQIYSFYFQNYGIRADNSYRVSVNGDIAEFIGLHLSVIVSTFNQQVLTLNKSISPFSYAYAGYTLYATPNPNGWERRGQIHGLVAKDYLSKCSSSVLYQ